MRGFAKRLKPLVTPTLYRAMEGIGPERGYALFMWYHAAYSRMTTEVERLDDEAATVDEIADALDALELDPAPDGIDATLAGIIRGEAQDLIEAAVVKTLASRERKRAQRIRAARDIETQARDLADDLADDREDDDDCHACHACHGDKRDNVDNGDNRDARPNPSPGPLSPSSSMASMRQSINARASARVKASSPSGLTGTSQKREVQPQHWLHCRNPDCRDPVDLAIEATGEDPADEDARRCWGAYLRDMGVDEFLETLHAFEIDNDAGHLKNPAAALNERMKAHVALLRLGRSTPLAGPGNSAHGQAPRTAGPDKTRD